MKVAFLWKTSRLRKDCLFEGPLGIWWLKPAYDPPRYIYFNLPRLLLLAVALPLTLHLALGLRQYWRERSVGHPISVTYLDVIRPGNSANLRAKRQADWFRAGLASAEEGKLDAAILRLTAGLAADPYHPNVHIMFTLGVLLLDADRPSEAFATWQSAVEHGFNDPAAIDACLAHAETHQNYAFIRAITEYLLASEDAAKDPARRTRFEALYGDALLHGERPEEAYAWATSDRAAGVPRAIREAVHVEALIRLGREDEAARVAAAGAGVAMDPSTALIHADALQRLSQPENATTILLRIAEDPSLTPNQAMEVIRLAYRTDPALAPKYVENYFRRFRDDRRSLVDLAVFLASQPNTETLRKLAAGDVPPDVAELLNIALGLALAMEGDTFDARQQLERRDLSDERTSLLEEAAGLSETDRIAIRNFYAFADLLVLNLDLNARVTPLSLFLNESNLPPKYYEAAIAILENNSSPVSAHETASIAKRHFPFINEFAAAEQRLAGLIGRQASAIDR
jgi:hypothetical protein